MREKANKTMMECGRRGMRRWWHEGEGGKTNKKGGNKEGWRKEEIQVNKLMTRRSFNNDHLKLNSKYNRIFFI